MPIYLTSFQDVLDFFKDYHLTAENVHLLFTETGKAKGECFAVFDYPEDARQAMGRNRATMGSRYVELFPSTIEEVKAWEVSMGKLKN